MTHRLWAWFSLRGASMRIVHIMYWYYVCGKIVRLKLKHFFGLYDVLKSNIIQGDVLNHSSKWSDLSDQTRFSLFSCFLATSVTQWTGSCSGTAFRWHLISSDVFTSPERTKSLGPTGVSVRWSLISKSIASMNFTSCKWSLFHENCVFLGLKWCQSWFSVLDDMIPMITAFYDSM